MKRAIAAILSLFLFVSLVQATDADGFASRSLSRKKIFWVLGDGSIGSAEFWSIPMGKFDFTVDREYPGEGTVSVEGSANLALVSSGYIDGSGYGDRGKMTVMAEFMVEEDGTLKEVKLDEIDYIYYGGAKVKLKDKPEQDLYIVIEKDANKVQAKGLRGLIYQNVKPHNELQHTQDIERIVGISFTKEGAKRAYQAALKANE